MVTGFHGIEEDPCLFPREINNRLLIVVEYVDDNLVAGSDVDESGQLVSNLRREFNIRNFSLAYKASNYPQVSLSATKTCAY